MRIEMMHPVQTERRRYPRGRIIDVDDSRALYWIGQGLAKPIPLNVTVERISPREPTKGKKQRRRKR